MAINNVSRFDKLNSPCYSASHLIEMSQELNKQALDYNVDPREALVNLSLHELNILISALKIRQ